MVFEVKESWFKFTEIALPEALARVAVIVEAPPTTLPKVAVSDVELVMPGTQLCQSERVPQFPEEGEAQIPLQLYASCHHSSYA